MKFGQTLQQRSIPQWTAYNVNYNQIKRLIKDRTSSGVAVPVSIPDASSNNRWSALEDELYAILSEEHDNVSLFLKSKYGELDRRLNYLEKQVKSAQRTSNLPYTNPALNGRRYHKLLADAESIGEDIQNLTRFTSVQKTAFRKLLKKYRKWTGSTSLQYRLEIEVFSAGQLNLDYAHLLERLTVQSKIANDNVQGALLRRSSLDGRGDGSNNLVNAESDTTVAEIKAAADKGSLALDAALAIIPFGKSSGSAMYWIHPDGLEEAEALILRHMRELHKSEDGSRRPSTLSLNSEAMTNSSNASERVRTHVVYFDNGQRLLQDKSSNRPSKIALSGRWSSGPEAVVTLSNLAPWSPSGSSISLKRKELNKALGRDSKSSSQKAIPQSNSIRRIQEYLSEHRDVKPLAEMHSCRTRYVSSSNSSKVGTWANLDSNIVMASCDNARVGSTDVDLDVGETFPHAVLEIRWEFSHIPEVVRAFDTSHLVEKVRDFSLELAAVHAANRELPSPPWKLLLERDIRKVPIATRPSRARQEYNQINRVTNQGPSSATSSTDGPTDSVFSSQPGQSSATSDPSPNASMKDISSATLSNSMVTLPERKKKKRARIEAVSPPPQPTRYWNEFDDGDEDVNPTEAYTIYIDPNESFPGTETISKIAGAVRDSYMNVTSRLSSLLFRRSRSNLKPKPSATESTGLLGPSSNSNTDGEADSSDSDSDEDVSTKPSASSFGTFAQPGQNSLSGRTSNLGSTSAYRPSQILTPRQEALERAYLQFYTGLLVLAYVILFMAGVLIVAGRKKARFEVDIAVVAGVVTAEACAVISYILIWMRKKPLSIIHWSIVSIAIIGIAVVGIGEIVDAAQRLRLGHH